MRISLRGGEKLYVNGAVFIVDRRVSIELLNDVTFLLEAHIMQAKDATTPLRQLYFVVQLMLMDPAAATSTRVLFDTMLGNELRVFDDPRILAGLADVHRYVSDGRPYDALRELRGLFVHEGDIIAGVAARAA